MGGKKKGGKKKRKVEEGGSGRGAVFLGFLFFPLVLRRCLMKARDAYDTRSNILLFGSIFLSFFLFSL